MPVRGSVRVWHADDGWGVGEDVTFTFEAVDQDGFRFRTVGAWPADQAP